MAMHNPTPLNTTTATMASALRPKIIASNWKMHGDIAEIKKWSQNVDKKLSEFGSRNNFEVVACLPTPYLGNSKNKLLKLGGQDCHADSEGAYTGDVSASMLQDLAVSYVLVGHSERRDKYGETNEDVQAKAKAALASGIVPIICVGENLDVRKHGDAEKFVCKQLRKSLPKLNADDKIIVAYEPVWAIGTGHKPNSKQVQSMLAALRATLESISDGLGDKTRLLYGGSVSADNTAEFCAGDSDGVLVGGASRKAEEFVNIVKKVSEFTSSVSDGFEANRKSSVHATRKSKKASPTRSVSKTKRSLSVSQRKQDADSDSRASL